MVEIIRGLVRPFVTALFTVAVCYGFTQGKIDLTHMLALYGPILGFWFGDRSASKRD